MKREDWVEGLNYGWDVEPGKGKKKEGVRRQRLW
jgi:hypothetical protein